MTAFLLVAGLMLSVAAGADQTKDQVVLIKTEDAEMAAAIQHAQATLDDFLKLSANPPNGASGFKLKVRLTNGGNTMPNSSRDRGSLLRRNPASLYRIVK